MSAHTSRVYPLIASRRGRFRVATSLEQWQQHPGAKAVTWSAGRHLNTVVRASRDTAMETSMGTAVNTSGQLALQTGKMMKELPAREQITMSPPMAANLLDKFEHSYTDEPSGKQEASSHADTAEALEERLNTLLSIEPDLPEVSAEHTDTADFSEIEEPLARLYEPPSDHTRRRVEEALARIPGTHEWREKVIPRRVAAVCGGAAALIAVPYTNDPVIAPAVAGAAVGYVAHSLTSITRAINNDKQEPPQRKR